MITIPVYDMIILPDIVYYFKSDVFQELNIEDVRNCLLYTSDAADD